MCILMMLIGPVGGGALYVKHGAAIWRLQVAANVGIYYLYYPEIEEEGRNQAV